MKDNRTKLEKEFEKVANDVGAQIQAKLSQASVLIAEAQDLAEKHGIPFYAEVSPLSQSYWASSFEEKWPGLDMRFVSDVTEAYSEYPGEGGWEHSAVC